MRSPTRSTLLAAALILAGCASDYHEKKAGDSTGYVSEKLSDDTFSVWFRDASGANDIRRADFGMLRCAELSLENGYPFFEVLDVAQTGHSKREPFDIEKLFVDGTSTVWFKIKCYKEKPPGAHKDAVQTRAKIRKQYDLN